MDISNIKLKIVFVFTLFGLIAIPIKSMAMKRPSDEHKVSPAKREKKEAWLNPTQTKIDLALETSNKLPGSDGDVEIHLDSFNCRYYGNDECNYNFTDEEDMRRHILRYHNILAARYFSK